MPRPRPGTSRTTRVALSISAAAVVVAAAAALLPRCTQGCNLQDHIRRTAKLTENTSLSGFIRIGSLIQVGAFDAGGNIVALDAPRLLMADCFPVDRVRLATTITPQCSANAGFKLSSVAGGGSIASLEDRYRLTIAKPTHRVLAEADLVPSASCVQAVNQAGIPAQALRAVTEELIAEEIQIELGMQAQVTGAIEELAKGLGMPASSYRKMPRPEGAGASTTVLAASDRDGLVLGYKLREIRLCFEADPSKCAGPPPQPQKERAK